MLILSNSKVSAQSPNSTENKIDKCSQTKCNEYNLNATCWIDEKCNCHCGFNCMIAYCNSRGVCIYNDKNELACE